MFAKTFSSCSCSSCLFVLRPCWIGCCNERGKPTITYRWIDWVWGITGWVQYFRKITNHFRGICRIYLKLIKKSRKITTCNQLNLERLGFWPIMLKILPRTVGHWVANLALLGTLLGSTRLTPPTLGVLRRSRNFFCLHLQNELMITKLRDFSPLSLIYILISGSPI